VSAGGRDRVRRRKDARPDDPTGIDRTLQRNVEQVAAGLDHESEIAYGREPGEQRGARVHRRAQRSEDGIILHTVHGPANR
jgi:hypothetical protein